MSVTPFVEASMARFMEFATEFKNESDRGCSVLILCVLEEALSKLVFASIGDSDAAKRNLVPPGRLTFVIENAVLLGLIGDAEARSFKALVKIRNEFAHKVEERLTFDTPRIALLCRDLPFAIAGGPKAADFAKKGPRFTFTMAASLLQIALTVRLDRATPFAAAFPLTYD